VGKTKTMEVDEEIKGRAEATRSSAVGIRLRGKGKGTTVNSTLANGGDIRHYEVRQRSSF
jgi:hypothetical protein